MTSVSPLESGTHRGYGFIEYAYESCAMNAIQHMNGFEMAGQTLKVGKASPSALLINLTTSKDKIVRGKYAICEPHVAHPRISDSESESEQEESDSGQTCLCLLNLVKPGDVDGSLSEEVKSECSKYGPVQHLIIHELTDHVRIFVEYENEKGALRAKRALHGRFFGGNPIQAYFYSIHKLRAQDYTATLR